MSLHRVEGLYLGDIEGVLHPISVGPVQTGPELPVNSDGSSTN